MDAKHDEVASEPLKYQTWFLKVSIHCEGCRRKVKKVLRSIDGVFTTTIDPQQQKVTVTGSVGVETLIRKLVKAGKHAEIWPEKLASGKEKTSGKAKKKNEQRDTDTVGKNHSASNEESNLSSDKNRGIESAPKCKSTEKSPAGNRSPGKDQKSVQSEGVAGKSGGGVSGSKKKKKKAQTQSGAPASKGSNGLSSAATNAPAHTGFQFQSPGQEMGQMNLSPTRQQSYLYPETYYLSTHNNRLYPMERVGGPSYYVPPLPYMVEALDQHPYQMQSAPMVSFEIFSDENANGCSIM